MCKNLCNFPYHFHLNFMFKITIFQYFRFVQVFSESLSIHSLKNFLLLYTLLKTESSFISINKKILTVLKGRI